MNIAIPSQAMLRRATEQARRGVRAELLWLVYGVEYALEQFAADWLPVSRPGRRSQEADIADLLCDDRGRSLRYRGCPAMQPSSLAKFDELIDALREQFGPQHACSEDLVRQFADMLRFSQMIRGAGGIYGLIRNGASSAVLAELATELSLVSDVASGTREVGSKYLQEAVAFAMCGPHSRIDAEWRRYLLAKLIDDGRPDDEFAALLVGDQAPFGMLISDPRRPLCLTWRRLVEQQLGVLCNASVPLYRSIDEMPRVSSSGIHYSQGARPRAA